VLVVVRDGLEDAVSDVAVATSAHRHVQLAARGAFVVEGPSAVDGEALDAGDGGGIAELEVVGDVAGGQEDPVAPAFVDRSERAVGVTFGDTPDRPVDYELLRSTRLLEEAAGN
jgi:hypothetical protein